MVGHHAARRPARWHRGGRAPDASVTGTCGAAVVLPSWGARSGRADTSSSASSAGGGQITPRTIPPTSGRQRLGCPPSEQGRAWGVNRTRAPIRDRTLPPTGHRAQSSRGCGQDTPHQVHRTLPARDTSVEPACRAVVLKMAPWPSGHHAWRRAQRFTPEKWAKTYFDGCGTSRLVHQPPALVGAPHTGLDLPEPAHDGGARGSHRLPDLRPPGARAGHRRAGHLVLLGPLPVRHPGLARADARAETLLPERRDDDGLRHHLLLGGPHDDVGMRFMGDGPSALFINGWCATRRARRCRRRRGTTSIPWI